MPAILANEKRTGICPVCGKQKLGLDPAGDRTGYKINCFNCSAAGLSGNGYLRQAASAVGCQPNQLIGVEAPKVLADWLDAPRAVNNRKPNPLPNLARIEEWRAALLKSGEPLAYLIERRKLSRRILRRNVIGWDAERSDLVFPVFADAIWTRELVSVLRRKPLDGAQMRAAAGHRRVPYPDVPPEPWALLVAGEIDALTGRQMGLPAVTVCGKTVPDHSVSAFAARPTAVMFDSGEEVAAERAVQKLRAAGGVAWAVSLAKLELPDDYDLNDYALDGGSRRELLNHIKNERRRA